MEYWRIELKNSDLTNVKFKIFYHWSKYNKCLKLFKALVDELDLESLFMIRHVISPIESNITTFISMNTNP